MADLLLADVYACTNGIYFKQNLTPPSPLDIPSLSQEFIKYSDVRSLKQFYDPNAAIPSEGEIYATFDNGDSPFDSLSLGDRFNTGDDVVVNFYPMGSIVGTVPTLIRTNSEFYKQIALSMGADNAAIVF